MWRLSRESVKSGLSGDEFGKDLIGVFFFNEKIDTTC